MPEALIRILNPAHGQSKDVTGKQHPNDLHNIYRDSDHDLDAINGTLGTADGDPNARSSPNNRPEVYSRETLRSPPEDIPDAGTVPNQPLASPRKLVESVEISTQLDGTNDRPLPLSQDTNITGVPRNQIPAGSVFSGPPVETPGSSDVSELETSKQSNRVNVPPGTTTNPPNGQDSIAQGPSQCPSTFKFRLDTLPEETSITSLPQPHPRIFPKRPRVHPPPRLPPIRPRPIWIVRRRTLPPPSNPLAEVAGVTNPHAPNSHQRSVSMDSRLNFSESQADLVHIFLVVICHKC
jgi:hypothetical protein